MSSSYLWPLYYSFLEPVGLSLPEDIGPIAKGRDYSRLGQIEELLPDDFVEAFAIAGSPWEVAQKLTLASLARKFSIR